MTKIGFLHSSTSGPLSSFHPAAEAFRRCLGKAGFAEGQGLNIEFRWAENRFERLPALARELVAGKPALIFVGGGDVAALAAKRATADIPIVFAIGADPVKQGLVSSLNRPGGNMTGATFMSVELRPKTLELIRELVPGAKSIAVMANPNRPNYQSSLDEVVRPARHHGLNVRVVKASSEREIDGAFRMFSENPVDALLVLSDPVFSNRRDQFARLEMQYKLPAVHANAGSVRAGSLVSYGASMEDAYCQAGTYAGRILKGEKPGDLPVHQPTRFELAINLKTAKALGLVVSPTLLARADEVIE